MVTHFAQVAVVADVIADAVFIHVGMNLFFPSERFGYRKGLQNRAGIRLPATQIVNLGHTGGFAKFPHEAGHIFAVDVVAYLLSFISKNLVFAALEIALHEIAKEAVQFDPSVVRTSEATAAQAAGRHIEITPVFLNHHISRHFRGTEKRVFRLIDGKALGNTMFVVGIGIIPTRLEFAQSDCIWTVAIDFVRGHVDKRRLRTSAAGGFEHIKGADGICIEVIEWDRCRAVVGRLRRSVNDDVRFHARHEVENALAVANIYLVMLKSGDRILQSGLIPPRVALRTKKSSTLVVVHPVNGAALTGKKKRDLGTDQAGGASDECFHKNRKQRLNAWIAK